MGKKRHEASSDSSDSGEEPSSGDSGQDKKKQKRAKASEQKGRKKHHHHHHRHRKERLEIVPHNQTKVDRDSSSSHQKSESDSRDRSHQRSESGSRERSHDTNKNEREQSRSRSRSQQRKRDDEEPSHTRESDRELEKHVRKNNRWDKREKDSQSREPRREDRFERENERPRGQRGNARRSDSFDHANAKWGKESESKAKESKKSVQEKDKPNFKLSGKLTEETNTYRGVVIKYSEPPEARKPRRRWRLYPFKGEKALQTLYVHRESAYLIGRERKVVDLPVDHPSCSKQHAVLQYRLVPFTRDDGSTGKRVRPYLIDLESANGTFINNKKIETKKYVELLEKDVIKFGFSSREYVLLHENSKDEALDDDVFPDDQDLIEIKKEEKE